MKKLFVLILLMYAFTLFSQCEKAGNLICINDEDVLSYKVKLEDEYEMFITFHHIDDTSFYSICILDSNDEYQRFTLMDNKKEVTNLKMNPAIFYPFNKVGLAALTNDIIDLKLIKIKDKNDNMKKIIIMNDKTMEDIHCIILDLVDKLF